MSMPSNPTPEPARWQFSIRDLLLFLTLAAVLIACWRAFANDSVVTKLRMMAASIVATAILGIAARSRMQKKSQGVPSSMADPYERFAFTCGLASILPYGAFWLMLQLDPYESSYRLAHGAMGVLFSFGIILFAPVVIGLLISLILFWGARSNPTLLAMRVIGLFANTVLLLALLLAIVGNI